MTACLSACTVGHLTQPPPIHSHKRKGWKYIVIQKICKQGTKRLWCDCTFYMGGNEEGNSSIWSPASGLMAESVSESENRPRPHVFTHGLHQVPSQFRAAPDNKAVTSCNTVCTRCTWHTVSETQWPPVTRRSNTHPQVKHAVRPGVLKCAITHYKAGRWDKWGRIWSGSVCEHFTHGWPAPVSVAASQLFWSQITSALWPLTFCKCSAANFYTYSQGMNGCLVRRVEE